MDIPTAAYLHIPFCRRRCYYCDFPIAVVGDRATGDTSQAITHYLQVLGKEIQATPNYGQRLTSVFFGGGTPSLLAPTQVAQILQTLERQFGLTNDCEISLEIDPGTFNLAQLQGYRSAGVNRVSLGIQTFQPELLAIAGRFHTVEQIFQAVDWITESGLTNFSLDLIAGLPGQTLTQWQTTLEAAIALSPTHLSAYDLVVEPTTVFGKRYQPGVAPLPPDETTADMYRLASQQLQQAGYTHYEISNYAQPGYQCRHNLTYWHNRPYYGFGMGATSYCDRQRYSRPRTRREYFAWVEALMASNGQLDQPRDTAADIFLETLMLGFRLTTGIPLEPLAQRFGAVTVQRCLDILRPYQQHGWVKILADNTTAARVCLTDPEGLLFSNTILAELWAADLATGLGSG